MVFFQVQGGRVLLRNFCLFFGFPVENNERVLLLFWLVLLVFEREKVQKKILKWEAFLSLWLKVVLLISALTKTRAIFIAYYQLLIEDKASKGMAASISVVQQEVELEIFRERVDQSSINGSFLFVVGQWKNLAL